LDGSGDVRPRKVVAMFPAFPSTSGRSSDIRRRFAAVVALGITVAFLIGMILFMFGGGASLGFVIILIATIVAATLLAPIVVFSQRKAPEKRKRNLDAYSLIDRLVEELDDDELAYLRRRLEARESALPDDVAASMEELLERRSEDRRAGKR
jgi:hypothetical protein